MKTTFTLATRSAMATALSFVYGRIIPDLPQWTNGLDFFSRIDGGYPQQDDAMEVVSRRYTFYVGGKRVLCVKMEGVAFNADEHGDLKPYELSYIDDAGTWQILPLASDK